MSALIRYYRCAPGKIWRARTDPSSRPTSCIAGVRVRAYPWLNTIEGAAQSSTFEVIRASSRLQHRYRLWSQGKPQGVRPGWLQQQSGRLQYLEREAVCRTEFPAAAAAARPGHHDPGVSVPAGRRASDEAGLLGPRQRAPGAFLLGLGALRDRLHGVARDRQPARQPPAFRARQRALAA